MSEVITNEDGIGFVKEYTPNLKLAIPYFDIATWHDYIDYNFKAIDAVINYIYKIVGFTGDWKNITTYKVDDIVFINDKDSQYYLKLAKIVVEHTTNSDDFDTFYENHDTYYEIFDEHILTNGIKIVKINQTLSLSANQPIQIDLTSYTNEDKSYYCIVNINQQIDRTKISGTCSYNKLTRYVTVENFNNSQSSVTVDFIMLIPVDKLVGFNNEINGLTNGLYQIDTLVKSSELLAEINNRISGDNSILNYIAELLLTLQPKIDNNNKLSSDLVDDTNNTNKFVTATEKGKINNSVQKTGDVMSGTLETTGIITDTLFVRENSSTTIAILSASIANSQIYFGNINYDNILKGSSLKYMDGTGTIYDVYNTKDVINGNGTLQFEYDNDLNEYVGKITLTNIIPNNGRMYKVCYYPLTSYLWPYIKSFGVFYTGPNERGCYIMVDQQLFIDYPNAHLNSYNCNVMAFPMTSSSLGYALFTLMGWSSYDSGYVSNNYTISEINKLLSAKQDTLIAGDNISIINNVISATGGSSGDTNVIEIYPITVNISEGSTSASIDITNYVDLSKNYLPIAVFQEVSATNVLKYCSYTHSSSAANIHFFSNSHIVGDTGVALYLIPIESNLTTVRGLTNGLGEVITALSGKQDTISDLATIRSGASQGATAVQPAELDDYQTTANLVTSVNSSSTDSQYPSAKLFYDTCGDIETLINAL